jgi:hypothetical protein
METNSVPRKLHKRGPKPIAEDRLKASFMVSRILWDWAADQPEGASRLLRDLLKEEYERRSAQVAPLPAGEDTCAAVALTS